MTRKTAIVGAGWAGCAAAVAAIEAGLDVTLLESSHIPGGRARRANVDGLSLDNGQHLFLGAYHKSLAMIKKLGINPADAFLTLPLQMNYPPDSGGMAFSTPALPAPLNLLAGLVGSKGLSWADRLVVMRFFSYCRALKWDIGHDRPVITLLEQFRQSPKLYALLWRPLCLAALNTPPEKASAKTFMAVLRDSVGRRRTDSNMMIPKMDLSSLFPERAIAYVRANRGTVHLGHTVRQITHANGHWILDGATDNPFDAIILATPAHVAQTLVSGTGLSAENLILPTDSITTCYLKYGQSTRLERPFYALFDNPQHNEWGQFVFDRSHLACGHDGILAVVTSASDTLTRSRSELCLDVGRQLARAFGRNELAYPEKSVAITEKRATFCCTPDLERPPCYVDEKGLYLAGDYVAGEYPATIESAVRSGIKAASLLAENLA